MTLKSDPNFEEKRLFVERHEKFGQILMGAVKSLKFCSLQSEN